jgi:hypothetical protein
MMRSIAVDPQYYIFQLSNLSILISCQNKANTKENKSKRNVQKNWSRSGLQLIQTLLNCRL